MKWKKESNVVKPVELYYSKFQGLMVYPTYAYGKIKNFVCHIWWKQSRRTISRKIFSTKSKAMKFAKKYMKGE